MSGVLHLRRERQEGEGIDRTTGTRGNGVCGMLWVDVTDDPGLVRCKLCRRRMATPEPTKPPPVATDPFEPGPPVPVATLGGAHTLLERELRVIERIEAGDDPSDRPRWRSLNAAISMWRQIGRDPSPIRSGWKAELESRSEGAVRSTFGRDEWIEVDRAIDLAVPLDVRVRIGMHVLELSRVEARAMLRAIFRGDMTATQCADDLTAAGRSASRDLVARVIRDAKQAMQDVLERKGLVGRRERSVDEREQEGRAMAGEYDVETWSEISRAVGRGEAACKRYAERAEDPLPVREQLGRVVAKRADLLAWVSRQVKERGAA